MNPRIVLAIARKDLLDAIRNNMILFAIAFPIGFWLLFSLIMPMGGDVKLGPVAVYDAGRSKIVEKLKAQPAIEKVIETRSADELRQVVSKEAVGGLILPADFDQAVAQGRSPELAVLINGKRGGGELAAFRSLVDDQVRQLVGQPAPAKLVFSDVNEGAAISGPNRFDLSDFFLVMLVVMGLAMTGVYTVPALLVEEKEKHTLKNILVSPASYVDVVAGKALVGMFYALFGAAILLALNDGLRGNVVLTVLAVVLGGLLTVEVGLLMGAAFTTMAQVNTWSTVLLLVLIAPTWVTGIWVAGAADTAMRLVPTYYVGDLMVLARRGEGLFAAWQDVTVLVGCVAIVFVGVVWALRREEK